jgi:hypothetical protein
MTITVSVKAALASNWKSSRGWGFAVRGLILLEESSCRLFPLESTAEGDDEFICIDDPVACRQLRDSLGTTSYVGAAVVVGFLERAPCGCTLRLISDIWLHDFEPNVRITVARDNMAAHE